MCTRRRITVGPRLHGFTLSELFELELNIGSPDSLDRSPKFKFRRCADFERTNFPSLAHSQFMCTVEAVILCQVMTRASAIALTVFELSWFGHLTGVLSMKLGFVMGVR
jgi:hypothetical protein